MEEGEEAQREQKRSLLLIMCSGIWVWLCKSSCKPRTKERKCRKRGEEEVGEGRVGKQRMRIEQGRKSKGNE